MLSKDPVFVVGVFRSGTSLLCSILNQNPKIALMYECDVWNFPTFLLATRFHRDWAERIEFYNQSLSRHKMVGPGNYALLKSIRDPLDLYQEFGKIKDASVAGEKSPFYCDRLVHLHSKYPTAAFIYVWRNPHEVYRSVLKAGETSRFFGKPGMLSRMIYHQEQAIRQLSVIEKAGARVFRVDYAQVVEQTEQTCRNLTAFLGVPYDSRMLQLSAADLSAIYKAPHHAYLRRGIIERQKYDREFVSPADTKKLERYRQRWLDLQSAWLKNTEPSPERPTTIEFAYHNFLGRALTLYDSLVRAGFEFLPLAWLRIYRLFKNWVVNPPSGSIDERTSLTRDLRDNWLTILTATAIFCGILYLHRMADPNLMFTLFYLMPCALLALVVNSRWATLFVLMGAFASTYVQNEGDESYRNAYVFSWNFVTRFILMEIFVLTLGRIRLEFKQTDLHAK